MVLISCMNSVHKWHCFKISIITLQWSSLMKRTYWCATGKLYSCINRLVYAIAGHALFSTGLWCVQKLPFFTIMQPHGTITIRCCSTLSLSLSLSLSYYFTSRAITFHCATQKYLVLYIDEGTSFTDRENSTLLGWNFGTGNVQHTSFVKTDKTEEYSTQSMNTI
jgi:hypothetical protein